MKVIDKGPGDHTVILAVREGLVQPFDAGAWLDLRIGFLLSICGATDPGQDDTITGLGELIANNPAAVTDQFWIGIRNNGTLFPGSGGVVFMGWTNISIVRTEQSKLIASDGGTGTSGDYWRPVDFKNPTNKETNCLISDGAATRATVTSPIHLVEDFSGGHAPGYATLILMRVTRPAPNVSSPITLTIKSGFTSGDVLFTSTPTKALLQANMESYPGTVQQLGPTTLSAVPDSFFLYWPFHSSRLRIHCMGIEVIAS